MTEHNEQSSTPVGDSIPEVHVENVDLGIPTETQSTEQNEEPKDTEPQPTIAFRRYEGEQQHTGILNTSMVRKGTGKPSIAEVAMYLPSDALDSSNDLIVELNEITDEDPLLADEQVNSGACLPNKLPLPSPFSTTTSTTPGRAPGCTTSSAPTCTAPSCRRTPGSPTT